MEISSSLEKEIKTLLDTKNINMNIADMLLTAYEYEDIVTKKKLLDKMNAGLTEKEAVFSLLLDFYQIDEEDSESIELAQKYIGKNLTCLDSKNYLENPYVKLVKTIDIKDKDYQLRTLNYLPYQFFAADEIVVDKYPYEEIYKVGYFKEKFSYLALIKGENVWMSLNPNEINTMEPFINDGKGNVLVLGLGMGYVSYMLSLKEDVKSITVVELDNNIINIFNKYIYPLLGDSKKKIKVVHDDGFRYLETNHKFDYIFADLWHNPEDGLIMYLNLQSIANRFNLKIHYWLNESLVAMKRRCLLTLIEENKQGFTDKDYRFAKNTFDQTINFLYKQYKNISISSLDDLKKLLEC